MKGIETPREGVAYVLRAGNGLGSFLDSEISFYTTAYCTQNIRTQIKGGMSFRIAKACST